MLEFNALRAEIHLNDSLCKQDRQCTYNVTSRRFLSIIYYECVSVFLHISSAVVICSLSGCTIYLKQYLINGAIFGEKVMESKICVLILSRTFV